MVTMVAWLWNHFLIIASIETEQFYIFPAQLSTTDFRNPRFIAAKKDSSQVLSVLKENNSPHFYQTPLSSVISKWCSQGFLPSCEAGPRVPPADSLWETMVTFILALLEALLGVGLGVCLLLPWGLNSSLSRPSIWSLVTGTAPCKQTNNTEIFIRL